MKKRFLRIVLAVLMLVSVLPVTAMAADGPTDTGAEGTQTAVGTVSTDGAIHVNKSVSADGKTLELEAFATNTVSTETTTITVKKEWRGLADGATKPEVEMTLWQSTDPDFKVLIENAGTLTLNGSTETTPWTGVFENVRLKNDEDEPLYYFVSETEIGGIDVPFTRTESVDVTR